MKKYTLPLALVSSLVITATCLGAERPALNERFRAAIEEIAQIEEDNFEETMKAHNQKLNELFREYIYTERLGGRDTSAAVKTFNEVVQANGMTTFDDFLLAVTTPFKHVKDPVSGKDVPIFGPLGSDIINGWLAAMGVVEGNPLAEQPMYDLASDALSEHIDFALIGIRDPTLSIELLPPGLQENARWAYQRLNPTNEFDGGFDHPLYYATIREATKKLFRVDYPDLRITMADVVVPEEEGGYGIRSCLLCHDRDHSGVYKRLLGQGMMYEAKIADLRKANSVVARAQLVDVPVEDTDEIKHAEAHAEVFMTAAQTVLDVFPDKIDSQAIKDSLKVLSDDDVARLKPGFDAFKATLATTGCLDCHMRGSNPPRKKDPGLYEGFVLEPNFYYKTKNINALLPVINIEDPGQSHLIRKVEGKMRHRGKDDMEAKGLDIENLRSALVKWVNSFTPD